MTITRPRTTEPAFTIAEVLCSLSIIGIIVVSLGSVLVLTGRGTAMNTTGSAANSVTARTAVDEVLSDLKVALTFTEQTATAVTFTVPDRNGDNVPETIRYAWSGVAGEPLTRQYNGGTAVPITLNVQTLNFNYLVRTIGVPPAPGSIESTEQLLMAHFGGTGPNIIAYSPTNLQWPCQYFNASPWPANTTAWRVTRIRLQMQPGTGTVGPLTIQFQAADSASFFPTGSVLDSVVFDPTTLPAGVPSWVDLTFSNLAGLDPTQGYCIVVTSATSGNTHRLYYDNASSDPSMQYCHTSNGGTSWRGASATKAFQYYVYGTITTQSAAPPAPPEVPATYK